MPLRVGDVGDIYPLAHVVKFTVILQPRASIRFCRGNLLGIAHQGNGLIGVQGQT